MCAVLIHKAVIALTAFVVIEFLPELFDHQLYFTTFVGNYGHAPTHAPSVALKLATWDAQHYLNIAKSGYHGVGPELAFYPLWPWLIRAGALVGRYWIAALVLSNLLSLAALLLLAHWVEQRTDRRVARWTVVALLVFPGSMFFCAAYSESLFLLLTLVIFWAVDRKHWALAALAALVVMALRVRR